MAAMATSHAPTTLWARRPELACAVNTEHRNPDYLRDRVLPPALVATADLEEALDGASVAVMAVPSSASSRSAVATRAGGSTRSRR